MKPFPVACHIITPLDIARFYKKLTKAIDAVLGDLVITNENRLPEPFEHQFQIRLWRFKRNFAYFAIIGGQFVYALQTIAKRRSQRYFFASFISDPFASDEIGRRWIFTG